MRYTPRPKVLRAAIALALTAGASLALAAPYGGTAPALPGTVQAENFDTGGEGVGYHDVTATNTGGQYRLSEGVDIISSADSQSGGYVVNNFQTGEWLAYTVSVATAGNFDIAVRASNKYASSTPAFHVEVDGINVTGSVPVPKTRSWDTWQWVSGKIGVAIGAGTHVIKVVSDTQYFNFDAVRLSASAVSGYAGTPFTGSPIALPKVFEAENFDLGGEGVAYHDLSVGNSGAQYRTSEDVDIVASTDSAGGGYVVNNFQTGEWMGYSVSVPTSGPYDISIRAADNYSSPGAFHIEIDGTDVTGNVAVGSTGGWSNFQWFGVQGVSLKAGTHVLKLVADAQYFNVNQISVLAGSTTSTSTSTSTTSGTTSGTTSTSGTLTIPPVGGSVQYACDFVTSWSECGMSEQNALNDQPGRATIVTGVSRTGTSSLRLHTEPGDSNVHGSGTWERDDMILGPSSSYCNEGQEEWWAVSMLFPSDYVFPPGPEAGILFDFHHNYSSGQSNFEIQTIPGTGLRLEGHGGSSVDSGRYDFIVADPYGASANITKNVWYDWVFHAKWSSTSAGLMEGWLNGKKVMTYNGATLYSGISCYTKLANYHAAFGQPSSVIFDRVVRGSSASAVAITPLQ